MNHRSCPVHGPVITLIETLGADVEQERIKLDEAAHRVVQYTEAGVTRTDAVVLLTCHRSVRRLVGRRWLRRWVR